MPTQHTAANQQSAANEHSAASLKSAADQDRAANENSIRRSAANEHGVGTKEADSLPRIGLGLLALALERARGGQRTGPGFDLGVGLVANGADRARRAVGQLADPPSRAAGWFLDRAARLPGADRVQEPLARAKKDWTDRLAATRQHGADRIAAGREQAVRVLRVNLDDGLMLARTDLAPELIDGLVPYLNARVVPQVIGGAVPQIRTEVLPVVIADLTKDPQVRDLILDQSRGLLDDAATDVRSSVANADDRVEAAAWRLFRRRQAASVPPTASAPSAASAPPVQPAGPATPEPGGGSP